MLCLYPLFWLAISYIIGELSAGIFSIELALLTVFLNFSILLFLFHRNRHRQIISKVISSEKNSLIPPGSIIISLCAISFLFGGFNYTREKQQLKLLQEQTAKLQVFSAEFRVTSSEICENEKGNWQIKAELLSINEAICRKAIPVMLSGRGKINVEYNDRIYAGKVLKIKSDRKEYPLDYSYTDYLVSTGIKLQLRILGKYRTELDNTFSILRSINRIRNALTANIDKFATPDTRGFLNAALLGYRKNLDSKLKNSFRETGISHIIAISGLHLSLIILITWYICSRLNLSKRHTAVISIITCLFFLTLSGNRPSVLRASVVAVIYLSSILIYRESNFINSLGAAALLICIIEPMQIYDIGMQLSFTSVFFISNIMQETPELIQSMRPSFRLKLNFWEYYLKSIPHKIILLLIVSVSAWLGVLPITVFYFHQVSIIGFIANLLIVPLMTFALAGGILLQFCAFLPAAISRYVAVICSFPAELIIWLSNKFSQFPLTSVNLFSPSKPIIIFYYTSFALLFLSYQIKKNYMRNLRYGILLLITISLTVFFYQGLNEKNSTTPEITLIENPDTETVLLRGKNERSYTYLFTSQKANYKSVIDFLYYNRVMTIDRLYIIGDSPEAIKEYCRMLKIKDIEIIDRKNPERTDNINPADSSELEIVLTRNKAGRILWYYFRNYDTDVLVSSWHNIAQFTELINNNTDGLAAAVKFIRLTANQQLNLQPQLSGMIFRYKKNQYHENRRDYGVIKITSGNITLWNENKYTELTE